MCFAERVLIFKSRSSRRRSYWINYLHSFSLTGLSWLHLDNFNINTNTVLINILIMQLLVRVPDLIKEPSVTFWQTDCGMPLVSGAGTPVSTRHAAAHCFELSQFSNSPEQSINNRSSRYNYTIIRGICHLYFSVKFIQYHRNMGFHLAQTPWCLQESRITYSQVTKQSRAIAPAAAMR